MYAIHLILYAAAFALQANAAPNPSPVALVPRATPALTDPRDASQKGVPELSSNIYASDTAPKTEDKLAKDGGQCDEYSECSLHGIAAWSDLERTVETKAINDVIFYDVDHEAIFKKYYIAGVSRGATTTPSYLQDDMDKNDLSNLQEYWRWTIWSLSADGTAKDEPCYEFSIHPKDGVIISHYSDIRQDSHRRLPWSEIVWQTYQTHIRMIFGGDTGAVAPLRFIIIHKIENEGTIKLFDTLAKEHHEDPKNEIEWYTYPSGEPFFISWLGTDPVQQVVRMVIDHNAAMGRRTISQIWSHGLSTVGKRYRDLWIKIDAFDPNAAGASST
ncbi:MAG: hypothetical protein Q9221_004855 [Calogaya cf. arnoldii]